MSICRRKFLFLLLLLIHLLTTQAIWFPWYFHRYGFESHSSRHNGAGKAPSDAEMGKFSPIAKSNKSSVTCPPGYRLKNPNSVVKDSRLCDDSAMVMQLARLYVVSPERIVLLLAQPQLMESCEEISDVLNHIDSATRNCLLAENNIYAKLANGLKYFKAEVCDGVCESSGNKKRCVVLNRAHSCLKELRTDMIQCEAPADWYERGNATKVCQSFNDVLDCYYTRGAMLCGLEAANQLRSFAGDSMKRALIHSCEVKKRLPRVTDPMPVISVSVAYGAKSCVFNFLFALFLLLAL